MLFKSTFLQAFMNGYHEKAACSLKIFGLLLCMCSIIKECLCLQNVILKEENARLKQQLRVMEDEIQRSKNHMTHDELQFER